MKTEIGDQESLSIAMGNTVANQKRNGIDDALHIHHSGSYRVIRRNGNITPFDEKKIHLVMQRAFIAVEGANAAASSRVHDIVTALTERVVISVTRRSPGGGNIDIEDIQDQVELALMRAGEHKVARAYVLYREERNKERASTNDKKRTRPAYTKIHLTDDEGNKYPISEAWVSALIEEACRDLSNVSVEMLLDETMRNLFDGVKEKDAYAAMVMSARSYIEREPNYRFVAARLLLHAMRQEALSFVFQKKLVPTTKEMQHFYADYFQQYVQCAVEKELLDKELLSFDLEKLGKALLPERDYQFSYLGLQTLYDRYFISDDETRLELPQVFFMRVAMGLAINESEREARCIEYYQLLSSFDFMSSTPTLFNSGTLRPQLSSCYLSTVPDNLHGIYDAIRDNALLSKYAGGLGNDWTPVRAMGTKIKGTNGKSQGVVPFLKVANDTAVAVNQGGKRKGALCTYLETWHLDIEEFLDLKKNTGDDRRRTHDMNTANWIPDLFMERVANNQDWTLFSPDEVPDLHDLFGAQFKERYEFYEQRAKDGHIKCFKILEANILWRRMLSMLYETGHPWITFKDPCNIRSPQQHTGTVHCSNLCTEITLNTSIEEIAVCNLGSINLMAHLNPDGSMNQPKMKKTIRTAIRMLDNVIDYNFYSVPQAERSNLRHRPIGMGIMGFQDCLYKMQVPYASEQAVEFADRSMEFISYLALEASADLAKERGAYASYEGSLWSKGILPIDSLETLQQARGAYLHVNQEQTLDWDGLRQKIQKTGIRNSNCLAIAPTATISNICGLSQSIEPTYQNLYVKSNLSGEFTVINHYLVDALKAEDLWDDVMISDLKYFDGSVTNIDRIPEHIRRVFATAFEIDPCWLIEAGARRQKWIDQAQSLNLYIAQPDGKKLDAIYKLAWIRGLKTTYYLRSLGATQLERSTLTEGRENKLAAVERNGSGTSYKACSIDDPDCEACQ